MADDTECEVPEGAAVFPHIPAELGTHPLLLAVLHATVFLAGSDDNIVHPVAADEAIQCIADYLRRLQGTDLQRVREDMDCLISYARQQKWQKPLVQALEEFLADCGVGKEGEA